jgi:uncharacterized protein (DUF58 family)
MTRRSYRGQKIGSRKTTQKGASVDFKDYREYNPGDDPRFIDWNVYGRHEKFLVKIFHSEEDVSVYVLVDASRSMLLGSPSKFDHARRIAAGITYLATTGSDRCRIATFSEGLLEHSMHADRAGQAMNLLRFLEKTRPGAGSQLARTVDEFLLRYKRRGVIFVISDFLGDELPLEALRKLCFQKYDVNLVQVLSTEDLAPEYQGMYELLDSEDEAVLQLFIDQGALDLYHQIIEEMTRELEGFSRQHGIRYVQTSTAESFEEAVLRLFGVRHMMAAG